MSGPGRTKQPTYLTASRLRDERGWTEELIADRLGPPDRRETNPHNAAAPPMRLYLTERVERTEREDTDLAQSLSQGLEDARRRAERRQSMRETDLIAEAASTVVSMRPLPSERATELIELALERRARYAMEHHGVADPSPVDPESRLAEELAIKMLRHEFTDYHDLLQQMPRAKNADANAVIHRAVQRRTLEKIAETVPELARTCRRMIHESGA